MWPFSRFGIFLMHFSEYYVGLEEVAPHPSATFFNFSYPLESFRSDPLAWFSDVSFKAFSELLASSASDWFSMFRVLTLSVDDSILIISPSSELFKSILFCSLTVVFRFAWGSVVNGFPCFLNFLVGHNGLFLFFSSSPWNSNRLQFQLLCKVFYRKK